MIISLPSQWPGRESNLGPLCARLTTLTTQLPRQTKVWSGNPTDVLQSRNLPPCGSHNYDSQFSISTQWCWSSRTSTETGLDPAGWRGLVDLIQGDFLVSPFRGIQVQPRPDMQSQSESHTQVQLMIRNLPSQCAPSENRT